ncbi:hypothetical protein HYS30_01075, partial [Candidatus Peregrinibacteria bacterium]|nr:hypothetical protein [Candidatus Peregrinibacteria bacterium]
MRTKMSFLIAAVLLIVMSNPASAQYPSYWYNYNVYPGGGFYNYSVSNGYEMVSVHQSASYGSAYSSYSYSSPYGSYSQYRNISYPTYYPQYH